MRLRRAERDDAHINLTPLIDVVFLLLIFFMVSTTFERESEIEIELPEATAERPDREAQAVEVWIDAEGRLYLDGRQLEDAGGERREGGARSARGPRAEARARYWCRCKNSLSGSDQRHGRGASGGVREPLAPGAGAFRVGFGRRVVPERILTLIDHDRP